MRTVTVSLITKPDCHLCDDARAVVDAARDNLATEGIMTEFEELNMLEDPQLEAKYREDIPVVLLNKKRHAFWRVDADRFQKAVTRLASKPSGLRGMFRE